MKKTILLFISFLLLFPIICAVEFDMKTELSQGETLMAKVSGNFVEPVLKESIFFYRGHVRIPIEYDIAKIDNEYYIYALLGTKAPNNYSISIENVKYMSGSEISEENLVKNFTITEETADFSIDPGFVITDKAFSIEVQNLQDFKIEIEINENRTTVGGVFESLFKGVQESENSVEVKSGEIKELEFDLGNETSFRIVQLSTENITYEIPIYVFVSEVEETEEEENVSSEDQNQTITEEEETTTEDNESIIQIASTKTCEEENGTICGSGEKCNETSIQARDATCCPGICEEIQKTQTGKIIGWSIVIIILVFLIWFFKKKYRGAKKEINLLKIAKGKKK